MTRYPGDPGDFAGRSIADRGHRQRPHQTPREFLFALADELGLPRDRLAGLADLLYQIRWGHAPPSAAGLLQAEQTVQQVTRRLQQG